MPLQSPTSMAHTDTTLCEHPHPNQIHLQLSYEVSHHAYNFTQHSYILKHTCSQTTNEPTIEIYIPRGEIMPFFSIPFGGGPQSRVIVYVPYDFLGCSVNEPVRQNRVSTTKPIYRTFPMLLSTFLFDS